MESVEAFGKYLGRPAKLADFKELTVASFLASMAQNHPATSVNSYRRRLLSIWEGAVEMNLLPSPPRRKLVRTLPEEIDPPEAWTIEQVTLLIHKSYEQRGYVCTVSASVWWPALFLSIYWTSCRISSMLAVPSAAYDGQGILVRKQKNHRPQWYPLPATCREIIERTEPRKRKMLFAHPWHPRTIWIKAREIIEAAGLPAPMTGRQLFHRLRRTTITYCAITDPAIAQRTAGHRDYATTLRHYIDPRILRQASAADILPDPLASPRSNLKIFG
jgi:hypothetical protein